MAVSERLRTTAEDTSMAKAIQDPVRDSGMGTRSASGSSTNNNNKSWPDVSTAGEEPDLEQVPEENDSADRNGDWDNCEAGAAKKRKAQPLKNPKKSLKRGKVPAPLNLSESNMNTHTGNSKDDNPALSNLAPLPTVTNQSVKSAPAQVTQHSKFQPRVQYLGKASSRQSIQVNNTSNSYGKVSMPSAGVMTAMNPYMPMNRYIMSPYYNPYGIPPPHMLNKPIMTPYGSYPYPMGPRTSIPFAMQGGNTRPYEENEYAGSGYRNKRMNDSSDSPLSGTASSGKTRRSEEGSRNSSAGSSANASPMQQRPDLCAADVVPTEEYHFERDVVLSANPKARSASTSTSTSTSRDRGSWQDAETNEDDEEGTDLAIEDGAVPTPTFTTFQRTSQQQQQQSPSLLHGEIRLSSHIFAFEFPLSSGNVDKKMFMSICNKVWNESKDLAKKSSSHHRTGK